MRPLIRSGANSATVYIEGDASMNTYEDAEGKTRSSLSIIQREHGSSPHTRRPEPAAC